MATSPNIKPKLLLILFWALFLTSCFPKVYRTSSGGVRFANPSPYWLKYKRQKYNNGQRVRIDSESIYELSMCFKNDSSYNVKWFARFFPEGQVLFFSEGPANPLEEQINDSLAGVPGYYAVEGDKLKFERWVNVFGDQTYDTYGVILNDSTLKIYSTYVSDCQGLFLSIGMSTYDCLEEKRHFCLWEKTNKYELERYDPAW